MSVNTGHGLPFLPGNTFRDLTKSSFHRAQTLGYKNGYGVPRRPSAGIGRDPLLSANISHGDRNQLVTDIPNLTYGTDTQRHPPLDFTPAHAAYDKKVLRFYGYFRQDVLHSPDESFRIRPVVIYYYLEDDSMCVIETPVENSGIPQGKLIKRQRLTKNLHGELYHWKDLNLCMDMNVFGTEYRITRCDTFTQEFMESQGIVLNEPESIPSDPYTTRRSHNQLAQITPYEHNRQLQRFLTKDRQVLRFFALWDDSDSLYGEKRPVTIHYYLVDDSVEICEHQVPNSGRDPFPVLLHRQKIPKHIKPTCEPFPSCVLEVTQHDVQEYFGPGDLRLGEEVTLMGRRFLLCNCDDFTRKFYLENYPEIQLKAVPTDTTPQMDTRRVLPPYNGFGSLEDSLQNCLYLIPEPPKKDVIKLLENDHKVLRYAARLDSQNPPDEGRRFILLYYLSNDMISIFERPTRNSGIIGGKFLEKTRVPKPGSCTENPEYYGPADFFIGASVEVFRHRFVLTDADRYVLSYLESVSDRIPENVLSSLRQKFAVSLNSDREKSEQASVESDGVFTHP
ncbi:EF-hand domain-containing protein 1 [Triplophysa tibetana]|uniref:EF-hand domain-containing protein 1 n=1 Tax=Triplophysa tibetana TaxID=1572043 RepID=A0A5A9NF26_9TELE|nr:EF-hand domain-containing protein 1 [Triplophysa tibetana]